MATPPPGLPAQLDHYIGGAPTPSADGATFEVADPVSNQPYATVAAGGPQDVDRAVEAAAAAFTNGPWPHLPGRARATLLNNIADAQYHGATPAAFHWARQRVDGSSAKLHPRLANLAIQYSFGCSLT